MVRKGALALQADKVFEQPVRPARLVDTLGAGDGFIAAFLLATLKGEAIEAALNRGAEYAAHVCTYRGAFGYETPIRPGQPGLVPRRQLPQLDPSLQRGGEVAHERPEVDAVRRREVQLVRPRNRDRAK